MKARPHQAADMNPKNVEPFDSQDDRSLKAFDLQAGPE
jgi:hypothetical protein